MHFCYYINFGFRSLIDKKALNDVLNHLKIDKSKHEDIHNVVEDEARKSFSKLMVSNFGSPENWMFQGSLRSFNVPFSLTVNVITI